VDEFKVLDDVFLVSRPPSSMSAPYVQLAPGYRQTEGTPADIKTGLKYFGNRLCPFAHRTWWAAHEKDVVQDLELIHVELGPSKPAWFQAEVNPLGTVPVLYDEGLVVYESLIIAEYLDEKYPARGVRLLPLDPVHRATARLLVSRFGDKLIKPIYGLLMEGWDEARLESLAAAARAALVDFNREIDRFSPKESEDQKWLVASGFSLAEIAIVPFLERWAAALKYYRNFELLPDDGKHDRLRASFEASCQRPAFQAIAQEGDFYVWGYQSYAKKKTGASE